MPKLDKNLIYQLTEFVEWLARGGQERTTQESLVHQGKKIKKDGKNLVNDIVHLAEDVQTGVNRFVKDLKEEPDDAEKLAREFIDKATDVKRRVEDVISDSKDLAKATKSALTQIKTTLKDAIKTVENFLSSLLSFKPQTLLEQKTPKFAPTQESKAIREKEQERQAKQAMLQQRKVAKQTDMRHSGGHQGSRHK
ncbi:MAG: hypothetical protein AB7D28_07685 [Candidatus Berkiella sp.]